MKEEQPINSNVWQGVVGALESLQDVSAMTTSDPSNGKQTKSFVFQPTAVLSSSPRDLSKTRKVFYCLHFHATKPKQVLIVVCDVYTMLVLCINKNDTTTAVLELKVTFLFFLFAFVSFRCCKAETTPTQAPDIVAASKSLDELRRRIHNNTSDVSAIKDLDVASTFEQLPRDLLQSLAFIAGVDADETLTSVQKGTLCLIADVLARLSRPNMPLSSLQRCLQAVLFWQADAKPQAFDILSRYKLNPICFFCFFFWLDLFRE